MHGQLEESSSCLVSNSTAEKLYPLQASGLNRYLWFFS
jgi:hypothetical protein